MFRSIFFFLVLILSISTAANAQYGTVYDDLSMDSKILKSKRKYAVYLPPDYNRSERNYPVLYLLHGAGDDHTGWVQFGEVLRITDEAIADGRATPMIIIMPDAQTGKRGYWDAIDGSWNYEQFFFEEFMPHVESKYRIKKEKRYRAISGLSMGGGGSFVYAMHRPDLFISACPMSAFVGPLSVDGMKNIIENNGYKSDDTIENYYHNYDALYMANNNELDRLRSVRWYIDCGDEDFLYEGNSLLHIAFMKRDIDHQYRVRDGAHNWTYWRESLYDVLQFVSDAFHQY